MDAGRDVHRRRDAVQGDAGAHTAPGLQDHKIVLGFMPWLEAEGGLPPALRLRAHGYRDRKRAQGPALGLRPQAKGIPFADPCEQFGVDL